MKKTLVFLVLFTGCVLLSGNVLADESDTGSGPVCFYEHVNFKGASFCSDQATANTSREWNNRVSSVRISNGYKVTICQYVDEGGRCLTLGSDMPDLRQLDFNDRLSSYKIIETMDNGEQELENGQALSGLSAGDGQWLMFKIIVPEGARNLAIELSGGSGDADLYTRYGNPPSANEYDCRPYKDGNDETCRVASPSAGDYFIGVHAYNAFRDVSIKASFDETGPGPDPNPDLSYTVTAVNDNLDNRDLYLMSEGLERIGYSRVELDTDVSSSELISYLKQNITVLYHTGHGFEGGVATSDGSINTGSTTVSAQNTIFATCLTLQDTAWRSAFGQSANTISGYTKVSFDGTDNTVVNSYLNALENGRSYSVAWYLANADIGSLSDRWCIYARQGGSIVEYSARTGNIPQVAAGEFVSLDADRKVRVSSDLLNSNANFESTFSHQRILAEPAETSVQMDSDAFQELEKTDISEQEAIAASQAYLEKIGEMSPDMTLDKAYPIQSREDAAQSHVLVGWCVRFIKQVDQVDVRGNQKEFYKTVMVTGNSEVIGVSQYWADVVPETAANTFPSLLTVGQALIEARDDIARRIKNGTLDIISVDPAYGIESRNGQALVPAYRFVASDGAQVVVDAVSGRLIE